MFKEERTLPMDSNRVNRGGSWNNNARNCRVSNRNNWNADNRNNNLGLRLALQLCPCSNGKNRECLLTEVVLKNGLYRRIGQNEILSNWMVASRILNKLCLEKSHPFREKTN